MPRNLTTLAQTLHPEVPTQRYSYSMLCSQLMVDPAAASRMTITPSFCFMPSLTLGPRLTNNPQDPFVGLSNSCLVLYFTLFMLHEKHQISGARMPSSKNPSPKLYAGMAQYLRCTDIPPFDYALKLKLSAMKSHLCKEYLMNQVAGSQAPCFQCSPGPQRRLASTWSCPRTWDLWGPKRLHQRFGGIGF